MTTAVDGAEEINPNKKNQISLLFIIKVMSVFSFGGMFSSLLIILEGQFGIKAEEATAIVGTFMGLYYMLPLLGGHIGDKKISFPKLFLAGQVMQMLGSVVFLQLGSEYLPLAFACFLANATVCSVSHNMFLNALYANDGEDRKQAFYWMYSAMNLGVIISLVATGYFELKNSYTDFYILSFFIPFATIPVCLKLFKSMQYTLGNDTFAPKGKADSLAGALVFLLILIAPISLIFSSVSISKPLLLVAASSIILFRFYRAISSAELRAHKDNFIKLAIYMLSTLLFYCIYMLMPTFFFLFIKHGINTVVWGFELPPQWVEIGGTLYIILATPICAHVFKKLKERHNITISYGAHFKYGVLFAIATMLIFSLGLFLTPNGAQQPLYWLAIYWFCLITGEIILAPTAQSVIAELVPKSEQGFFSGVTSTILGLSVMISSYIAQTFFMPIMSDGGQLHLSDFWDRPFVFGAICSALFFITYFSRKSSFKSVTR